MQRQFQHQLTQFIEQELDVQPDAIALAWRNVQFPSQLPVSLWQYGLISLEGVSRIWSWIEARSGLESVSSGTCA